MKPTYDYPLMLLKQWLVEEQKLGAPNPQQAVLSTVAYEEMVSSAFPHSRVVAIREITLESLLFFTQTGTRKVSELRANPNGAMTFWFELYQREVVLEGVVEPLSEAENQFYWESYPREAQIRFYSYAVTSAQPIASKQLLVEKKEALTKIYTDREIPMSPFYLGFRFNPVKLLFYAYQTDVLSDVFEYRYKGGEWHRQLLSP